MTMADVALNATGSMEGLFAILVANGRGITEAPYVGDSYIIPDGVVTDTNQLQSLAGEGIVVATGDDTTLYEGISYWKVAIDFKVS